MTITDIEHWSCTDYQMLAWTLPHRRSGAAQPAQPHHHPSIVQLAQDCFSPEVRKIAMDAIEAAQRLYDNNQWPTIPLEYCLPAEEELQDALDRISLEEDEGVVDDEEVDDNEEQPSKRRRT